MKFYDREQEMERLRQIRQQSLTNAQYTVVTGRRRIGKTQLLFQEFLGINPSVYSDMQHYWDVHKASSRINLLVCGSVHSLMHRIFEDYKAPLFGRATSFMQVHPFRVSVLKEILSDNNPAWTPEDLLALYAFTGGVAKYVQLLVDNRALTLATMLDYITFSGKMPERYFRAQFKEQAGFTQIGAVEMNYKGLSLTDM